MTLVPDERRVLRNGQPIALTPKAFDLLLVLAENPEIADLRRHSTAHVSNFNRAFRSEFGVSHRVFRHSSR